MSDRDYTAILPGEGKYVRQQSADEKSDVALSRSLVLNHYPQARVWEDGPNGWFIELEPNSPKLLWWGHDETQCWHKAARFVETEIRCIDPDLGKEGGEHG